MLLQTLIAIDTRPGMRASSIAWEAFPEHAARRAAVNPRLVGLWFSGLLKRWQRQGYVFRKMEKQGKRLPNFYLTTKGIEVLMALGVERARIKA